MRKFQNPVIEIKLFETENILTDSSVVIPIEEFTKNLNGGETHALDPGAVNVQTVNGVMGVH